MLGRWVARLVTSAVLFVACTACSGCDELVGPKPASLAELGPLEVVVQVTEPAGDKPQDKSIDVSLAPASREGCRPLRDAKAEIDGIPLELVRRGGTDGDRSGASSCGWAQFIGRLAVSDRAESRITVSDASASVVVVVRGLTPRRELVLEPAGTLSMGATLSAKVGRDGDTVRSGSLRFGRAGTPVGEWFALDVEKDAASLTATGPVLRTVVPPLDFKGPGVVAFDGNIVPQTTSCSTNPCAVYVGVKLSHDVNFQ